MSRRLRDKQYNTPVNPDAVNNIAPSEVGVMESAEHGPKYVIYRMPQGWGWGIRTGRGGVVPSALDGLFTSERHARLAIHGHELETSTRYRINPEKQVV